MTGLIGVRFQEGVFREESCTHLMGTGFKGRSNIGVNVGKRVDGGEGKRDATSRTNIFRLLVLVPKNNREGLGKMLGDQVGCKLRESGQVTTPNGSKECRGDRAAKCGMIIHG